MLLVNEYQLQGGTRRDVADVVLRRMPQITGRDKWAIIDHGAALNKDGEWEIEPQPSSRIEVYLRRCRFDSMAQALEFWNSGHYQSRFTHYDKEEQDADRTADS